MRRKTKANRTLYLWFFGLFRDRVVTNLAFVKSVTEALIGIFGTTRTTREERDLNLDGLPCPKIVTMPKSYQKKFLYSLSMKAVFFDNCCQSAHSDAEVLHAVSRAIEKQHVNTESRIPVETSDVVSRGFAQTRTKRYVILLIIHLGMHAHK